MKTIWKYPIECNSIKNNLCFVNVTVPIGAKPLCFMAQDGQTFVWFEVDTVEKQTEYRKFCCVGTGHGIVPEENWEYFGSVCNEGFVWHLYK